MLPGRHVRARRAARDGQVLRRHPRPRPACRGRERRPAPATAVVVALAGRSAFACWRPSEGRRRVALDGRRLQPYVPRAQARAYVVQLPGQAIVVSTRSGRRRPMCGTGAEVRLGWSTRGPRPDTGHGGRRRPEHEEGRTDEPGHRHASPDEARARSFSSHRPSCGVLAASGRARSMPARTSATTWSSPRCRSGRSSI